MEAEAKPLPVDFEKSPLQSKKFVIYLIADIGWTLILGTILVMLAFSDGIAVLEWALMMGIVLVKGFLQVGTILGQASLDKFVRVAQINASMGMPTKIPEKTGTKK